MMMKFITISLIPVYLFLTSGVNILVHTCGGTSSVYIMPTSTEDPCTENNMQGCSCSSTCCKLELKVFQINEYQIITGIQTQIQDENINFYFITDNNISDITHTKCLFYSNQSLSPPIKIPIHLFDCTLLI